MATIKDISKAANVSIATVSKVLNGDYSKVSLETKKRILKIAKELNYRPNRLARGLASKSTGIIGLIVPDITNPYYAELAQGVENKADKLGYTIMLCNTGEDTHKENSYIDVLIEYNADGVIITGNEKASDIDNIQNLHNFNIPFVLIDRMIPNVEYNVMVDNIRGAYIATEYIIKNGHRKIAFIGGEAMAPHPMNRLQGFLQAMKDYGVEIDQNLIRIGTYHVESGYKHALELLESDSDFTAIVCGNDLIAYGAIKAIKQQGLKVPEDISVIGYDDIFISSLLEPPLTTIKQPTYDLGAYATEILIKLIKNESVEEKVKLFVPQLVVRKSVISLS